MPMLLRRYAARRCRDEAALRAMLMRRQRVMTFAIGRVLAMMMLLMRRDSALRAAIARC